MKGIQFVVDDRGKKVAVQIDLRTHGELWEDFYDALVVESRRHEKNIPFENVKASLVKTGTLRKK
jgi:hypothetical protein